MSIDSAHTVLVVDDEPDIRELLELTLVRMGLAVDCAENFTAATRLLQKNQYSFCLTDLKLPDGDGISLVAEIQQRYNRMPVAVITAHGSMELAIEAMKAGAYDFVSKPISLEKLRKMVETGIAAGVANGTSTNPEAGYRIIGDSKALRELRKTISKFSRSLAPVFIEGESGTGKELVARQIHVQSARGDAPFVAVNCGAIPSELMESELFGHVKGSFTGAVNDNPGLFKTAEGGTLFLDEIGDLPLTMQVKLLRVIQEKSIRPVGASREENIDVRIISASHKNLKMLVDEGKFRNDLFYRINVIDIQVPALRERTEDIEAIAKHILQRLSESSGISYALHTSAIEALRSYDFPGNVRELENILERATALTEGSTIRADDLTIPKSGSRLNATSLLEQTSRLEAAALEKALQENKWNQSAAARQLGITLRQLRYRCEKMGLLSKNE